jgi:acyl-CoA thioesterase-1
MIPILALLFLAACAGSEAGGDGAGGTRGGETRARGADQSAQRDTTGRGVILFLGTSLTAGYGLDGPEDAYPALIQRRLDSLGLPWRAVNAGVSGETSAGALRRLEWLLEGPVRVLVVESGANDMLRGQGLDSTRANLEAMVRRARSFDSTITIVLAGMEALPNLGERYAEQFRRLYPELARREGLALIPFLLAGVGGVDSLNQPDGIHPTERGQQLLARNVWAVLEPILSGLQAPRRRAGSAER